MKEYTPEYSFRKNQQSLEKLRGIVKYPMAPVESADLADPQELQLLRLLVVNYLFDCVDSETYILNTHRQDLLENMFHFVKETVTDFQLDPENEDFLGFLSIIEDDTPRAWKFVEMYEDEKVTVSFTKWNMFSSRS